MALISKSQILGASDITTETVAVPEWGGDVLVRGLSARQRGAWQQSMRVTRAGKPDMDVTFMNVSLCMLCIVDEDGKRMFEESELLALADKSASAIEAVARVALRLSGLDEEDRQALLKGSTTTQSVDSSSG